MILDDILLVLSQHLLYTVGVAAITSIIFLIVGYKIGRQVTKDVEPKPKYEVP